MVALWKIEIVGYWDIVERYSLAFKALNQYPNIPISQYLNISGVAQRQGEMLVGVVALQYSRFRGVRPPVGSAYFFADTISFVRLGTVGQHHRKEVKDEHQSRSCLIPERMSDSFSGRQQMVAQPADVFPEYLSAATGIADFKRQTVDVLP